MVNVERLNAELLAAGLSISGVAVGVPESFTPAATATLHVRPDGRVKVVWVSVPDAAQITLAEATVQAHDGTPTPAEAMDAVGLQQRTLAANAVKNSSHWAALSTARKAQVQQAIDDAAAKVIAALGWS